MEGYVMSIALIERILVESDSLLANKCLSTHDIELFEIDALASNFIHSVDNSSISFSHVNRLDNNLTYLLGRFALDSDLSFELLRNIRNHISHIICLILIKWSV